MPGILADHDITGQFNVVRNILEGASWGDIWMASNCTIQTFETLGLDRDVPDSVLWQECQRRQIVLVTGNRNAKGLDSLESTIQRLNTESCLPVITLADTKRILHDKHYAERVAERLLDYVLTIENLLGVGRLYVP